MSEIRVSIPLPKIEPLTEPVGNIMVHGIDQPVEAAPIAETPYTNNALTIPKKKPYLISAHDKELLTAVDSMSRNGLNTNILVTGPQGIGKSELVAQFAATRQRPLATLEIGNLSESSQIFGHRTLENGQIVYVKGLFTEAITTPNAVVHLQEINRPENDKALNAIFSVLDDTFRTIWVDEAQQQVKVAPGVTFFASLNEGFEFVGTLPLDEALRNRFHIKMDLKPLPEQAERTLLRMAGELSEEAIDNLMSLVGRLRGNTQEPVYISTRDIINAGKLVKHGLNPMTAVKAVIGTAVDKLESLLFSEHLAGRGVTQQEEIYGLL